LSTEPQAQREDRDVFWEPARVTTAEVKIKRSLFIGRLFPCRSVEDVRTFLTCTETEHKNAAHHCWAYLLDSRGKTKYFSDDGEPAGTAGKPILSAIERCGMVNLLIVVTRYFGGIKLGVRGLIEAYGQAASNALERAERVRRVRSRKLAICLPYAIIKDITYLLEVYGLTGVPRWNYGSEVEVIARVKESAMLQITAIFDELQARKRIHSWKWLEEGFSYNEQHNPHIMDSSP
jgi:uncharacterized YigZ family protein